MRDPARQSVKNCSASLSSDKLKTLLDEKSGGRLSLEKASTMPHWLWRALKTRGELSQSEWRRPPFQKPKSSKNSQPLGLNVYTFVQTETQMTSNEIKIPVDQNLDDAKFPLITFTNVDIKASSNQPLS